MHPVVGTGVIYLIGIILSYIGMRQLATFFTMRKWPYVKGEVRYTVKYPLFSTSGIVMSIIEVHYKYTVDNTKYLGYQSFRLLSNIVPPQFQDGKKINVFFNPNNPCESVIRPEVNLVSILFLTVGTLLVIISVSWIISYLL